MFNSFSIKHANERSKSEAWRRLKITIVISFLPLVLGFIGVSMQETYWTAFNEVFLSGELYFYAMSFCASIYVISQLNGDRGNLDMRMWSGVFVLSCAAFMAYFLGQDGNENSSLFVFHGIASVVFLLSAVNIYYRVMVLNDQPAPMPEDINRKRADDMADRMDPDFD